MSIVAAKSLLSATSLHASTVQSVIYSQRRHATQNSLGHSAAEPASRRKAVTPFNDDGRVPWTELSAGEKTARAAQQTFNWGLVTVGVILTGTVSYFLYREVFSTDSKISNFNRAVDRIRTDPRTLRALGEGKTISAHGEETWSKWRRARPIASTSQRDQYGNDHLMMHFHVEGPRNKGTAHLQLTRKAGEAEYHYRYFYVDIPGQPRIYLESPNEATAAKGHGGKGFSLFGVKWS